MRALLFAALAMLLTATAEAACTESWRAKLEGPAPVGFLPSRFGVGVAACAHDELELGAAARAIVEPSDFYGNLSAAALVAGSLTFLERGAVFGSFEVLRYQTVISSLTASMLAPGRPTVGASWRFVESDAWVVTGFGRSLIPTDAFPYENAKPFGVDAGAALQLRLTEAWTGYGTFAALATGAVSQGPADLRFGFTTILGATFRPTHGFALVTEADARFGRGSALEYLALGAGLRVHLDRRGFELFVKVPVAGRERSLATLGLRLRYDFGVALDRRLR